MLDEAHARVVVHNVETLTRSFKQWLKEDVDYTRTLFGHSGKPSLLDPGAQKLRSFFQAYPEIHILEHVDDTAPGKERIRYAVRADVTHVSGVRIGSGVGSCSTDESKYQYRWLTADRLRDRVIMGTTLTTTSQSLLDDAGFKVAPLKDLYGTLVFFRDAGFRVRLSLEPLYSFNPDTMAHMVRRLEPEVVEVGLDNYLNRHRIPIPQPTREGVQLLLQMLAPLTNTRVVLKKGMRKWLNEPDQPHTAEEEAMVC